MTVQTRGFSLFESKMRFQKLFWYNCFIFGPLDPIVPSNLIMIPLNLSSFPPIRPSMILTLMLSMLLFHHIHAAPLPPSSAEMWVHQDSTSPVEKFPQCKHLIGLTNAENSNKATYGEDMRACFSPDTFNIAPAYQQWKSQVGDYVATPSGDDRPYLFSDRKGTKGAKLDQPFVKGSNMAKLSFGKIKGPGMLTCYSYTLISLAFFI